MAASVEAAFNLPKAVDKEPTRRFNLMIPDSMYAQADDAGSRSARSIHD
ncbi:MAG: hypothetical protein Q3976_07880 [Corynebacterium sp.]|nr:hypothetical protein [Corynebacterium sp.]